MQLLTWRQLLLIDIGGGGGGGGGGGISDSWTLPYRVNHRGGLKAADLGTLTSRRTFKCVYCAGRM